MVEKTPRLGLSTYEPGDTDWDHSDTVEAVDETIIARGPFEERPEEGAYDNELYHAIDQRITWRWDAQQKDWEPVGGFGSADTAVPGTSYFESIHVDALNGRTHLKSGLTNDEINDRLRDLEADGGGAANFSSDTYAAPVDDRSEQPAVFRGQNGVNLEGAGWSTVIRPTELANGVFWDAGDDRFVVSGLHLDGNAANVDYEGNSHEHSGLHHYRFGEDYIWAFNYATDWIGHAFHSDASRAARILFNVAYDNPENDGYHIATRTDDNDEIQGPAGTLALGNISRNTRAAVSLANGRHSVAAFNSSMTESGTGVSMSGHGHLAIGNMNLEGSTLHRMTARRTSFGGSGAFEDAEGQLTLAGTNLEGAQTVETATRTDGNERFGVNYSSAAHNVSRDGEAGADYDLDSVCGFVLADNVTVGFEVASNAGGAIRVRGNCENVTIRDAMIIDTSGKAGAAVQVCAPETIIEGALIDGTDSMHGLRVTDDEYDRADGSTVRGVTVKDADYNGIRVAADNCLIDACSVSGSGVGNDISISNETKETIIQNSEFEAQSAAEIREDGIRTLVDGRGVNEGNPNETGQWEGHEAYAEDRNALIEDTVDGDLYAAVSGRYVRLTS